MMFFLEILLSYHHNHFPNSQEFGHQINKAITNLSSFYLESTSIPILHKMSNSSGPCSVFLEACVGILSNCLGAESVRRLIFLHMFWKYLHYNLIRQTRHRIILSHFIKRITTKLVRLQLNYIILVLLLKCFNTRPHS